MDQFVCVRMVKANGMDLNQFQFDYDLTFAAFFLNAEMTIYGRFGSRSERKDATKDMSIEGLRKAMDGALELHRQYPANRASLAGKKGPPAKFPVPEEYPSLKGKYTSSLDYEGKIVASCIHCHQAREAERLILRGDSRPMPDEVLFPWPMPDVVGLALDAKEMASVKQVAKASSAELDGFKHGDSLLSLAGQPLLSIADVQWVLHQTGTQAKIPAKVRRDGKTVNLDLTLEPGWRQRADISGRATTWDLRRMGTGGLLLESITAADHKQFNLPETKLALRVEHVGGGNGPHAAAKKAGFLKNDILVEFDGRTQSMTESALLTYVLQNRFPGAQIPVTVLRGSERVKMTLPMQ